ncbi:MAG: hypothetical protein CME62_04365 [Halobacteriovoraceae bacterium]|nr:hypothetical protein [Halobacteriovoraceae bacterium]|tara:strand:+ start:15251 stop:15535 length:285 start_codon:yes stop_codon:yes gene_type:complete
MNIITEENWNYTFYENLNFKVFISLTAYQDEQNQIETGYIVNITDEFDNEVLQKNFVALPNACRYINDKYASVWNFTSRLQQTSGSGCSTCVAH